MSINKIHGRAASKAMAKPGEPALRGRVLAWITWLACILPCIATLLTGSDKYNQ